MKYLTILIAIILVVGFWYLGTVPKMFGDSGVPNRIYSPSYTSVACSPQGTLQILPASSARIFASFAEESTSSVLLCFGATCASTSTAYDLYNYGNYKIDTSNLYIGPLSCIAQTTTTTIGVTYQ